MRKHPVFKRNRVFGWLECCGLSGLLGLAVACSSPVQGGRDSTADSVADAKMDPHAEASQPDAVEVTRPDGFVRPAGMAAIRFRVDDTANRTYQDGQMKFTGSFSWDAATNTITYATSWLPTDGPFPPLYDDGPWSAGGHEPEGAAAGDHRFDCEVWFKADEETTFEYGVLNEFDRWIWIGPNGVVTVPKGSQDVVELPGLTLPPFGETDLKVTLDLAVIHPDFGMVAPYDPFTGLGYRIYLKSSANSWTPVELLDDGQRGDDVAGDGVFTYVQSQNLGPHDGRLYEGQHAQFVFVFAMEGVEPDDGLEYKVENHCATEGVKAYTDHGTPGSFHEEPILLERDSRGKVFNTTVIVGGGAPWCVVSEDCFGGVPCEAGACGSGTGVSHPAITGVQPPEGPAEGGTSVSISGSDFRAGAKVFLGGVEAASVSSVSGSEVQAVTPAHEPGAVDVTLKNPDGGTATAPAAFTFVGAGGAPVVQSVAPEFGTTLGGTAVTLAGQNFRAGAVVLVDEVEVVPDSVTSSTLTFKTPKHAIGSAVVKVRNPDGSIAPAPKTFTYVPIGTPVLDGRVGTDWDETFRVASNAVPTNWGPGLNELEALYVAYDQQFLYIGIRGVCEPMNAIVGYLDLDFQAGTGFASPNMLQDSQGALDNALSMVAILSVPGFGAEFGFGTVGMAEATGFAGRDPPPPALDSAGWRQLHDANDLWWVLAGGEVLADPDEHGVETWVPLSVLFPDGPPAGGTTIALVVYLVNADGTLTSNQSLPGNAGAWEDQTVAPFPYR